MKPVFIVEMKSDCEYFMTPIKGRSFWHNELALSHSSIICWKYRPFIEVMKYSPSDFISTVKLKFEEKTNNQTKTKENNFQAFTFNPHTK